MKRQLFTYFVGRRADASEAIGWRKSAKGAAEFAAILMKYYEEIVIWRRPRRAKDFSY
jgi:hypothetical protein